jgi:alkylation response protein AidB-like acyl-CoA dehydrogenase
MDLLPTPEQDEIVSTVRARLDKDFDLHALASLDGAPSIVDRDLWRSSAELGWFGLGLDEDLGGVGYTLVEEALLFAELGAHATPGPFLATVLAVRVAGRSGAADVAAAILGGEQVVALAEPEGVGAVGAEVSGTVRVTDHGDADLLLVVTADGASLLDAGPVDVVAQPSLDPLVPLGVANLDRVPAVARLEGADAADMWRRGTVLVAAELAGVAAATAAQSTEYAKDREQFGRPIGSFQAVKHRCADMAVRAEAATSLVRYASLAVADGRPDGSFHADAARTVAGDAALANAQINVQNHGGIGFTWEHTAHRYVTRTQVLLRTLGDRRTHLGALLAEPAPS